jgi:hypothetical protein
VTKKNKFDGFLKNYWAVFYVQRLQLDFRDLSYTNADLHQLYFSYLRYSDASQKFLQVMLVNERTFIKLNYRNLWRTKKLEVESDIYRTDLKNTDAGSSRSLKTFVVCPRISKHRP